MTEFVQYVKATVLKLIGLTCIVAAVLFVVGWRQCVTGWCIGSGLNIVYFLMLSSRSVRALKLPPGQAAAFIRSGAVFRLFMIGLILIVILQFPGIHFWSCCGRNFFLQDDYFCGWNSCTCPNTGRKGGIAYGVTCRTSSGCSVSGNEC